MMAECLDGAIATEIRLGQYDQVCERCLPLEWNRGVRGMRDCGDKDCRLTLLDRTRPRDQRSDKVANAVGPQAPQDGVAQWVEPGKAEKRVGAKPVEAPRPVLDQPRRDEPGLGKGRQYLCIAPEQKPRADPGERS